MYLNVEIASSVKIQKQTFARRLGKLNVVFSLETVTLMNNIYTVFFVNVTFTYTSLWICLVLNVMFRCS